MRNRYLSVFILAFALSGCTVFDPSPDADPTPATQPTTQQAAEIGAAQAIAALLPFPWNMISVTLIGAMGGSVAVWARNRKKA